MAKYIVVIGPAGSGKTTMATRNRKAGDIIIDYDLLFQAVTAGKMFERDASLKTYVGNLFKAAIALPHDDALTVWVVTTTWRIAADVIQKHNAHIVVMATPASECIRRIHKDSRRQHKQGHERIALEWWRDIGSPVVTESVVQKKLGGVVPASITIEAAK